MFLKKFGKHQYIQNRAGLYSAKTLRTIYEATAIFKAENGGRQYVPPRGCKTPKSLHGLDVTLETTIYIFIAIKTSIPVLLVNFVKRTVSNMFRPYCAEW